MKTQLRRPECVWLTQAVKGQSGGPSGPLGLARQYHQAGRDREDEALQYEGNKASL